MSSHLLNEFKSNVKCFRFVVGFNFFASLFNSHLHYLSDRFFCTLERCNCDCHLCIGCYDFSCKNKRLSNEIIPRAQGLIQSVVLNSETVRLFTDSKTFFSNINSSLESARSIRVSLEKSSNTAKADVALSVAILTVLVVFTSVIEVFEGQLSVGSLIALNILCARTLVQVNSSLGVGWVFNPEKKFFCFFCVCLYKNSKSCQEA